MRALITGAGGFVGQNLISYFRKKNIDFKAISRGELSELNESHIEDEDCIIHLAGKAHDLSTSANPDDYYKINLELTKALYKTFLSSNASKFIFISSVKAAADKVIGELTEDISPKPETHYGKSKLLAEQFIQSQPLPQGKSWFILRPCMIHGPGNKGNMNLLYKFVKYGLPYILGAFDNRRSFLSIENLCFLIKEIMDRDDIPYGIYNVADSETLSTSELVNLMGTVMGKRVRFWNIPTTYIKILAGLGDKLRLPLTTERLSKLTENYIVDNSKLEKALKKKLPIEASDGLKHTLESFESKRIDLRDEAQ